MTRFVGAGIGWRRRHGMALAAQPGLDVLELSPDHFFARPAVAEQLAERFPIVMHDVGLSVGTLGKSDAVGRARLARIRELGRRVRPLVFSDHLALVRSPSGIDVGHLFPIAYDEAMLRHVSERVRAWQDALGVPVALENIHSAFDWPGAMSEPELFGRLCEATGCGLLLDLTNLLYSARNRGEDPLTLLSRYPLEAVVQVHLAGGVFRDGEWLDTHSRAVDRDALALLPALARRARPFAIIVERDAELPSLAELVAEARQARAVWEAA